MYGGAGADDIYGMTGSDLFVYRNVSDSTPEARDTITFSPADGDRINLSRIDADMTTDFNQAFKFHGESMLDQADESGWLTYIHPDGRPFEEILVADVDGDKQADIEIYVRGPTDLTASDFIL